MIAIACEDGDLLLRFSYNDITIEWFVDASQFPTEVAEIKHDREVPVHEIHWTTALEAAQYLSALEQQQQIEVLTKRVSDIQDDAEAELKEVYAQVEALQARVAEVQTAAGLVIRAADAMNRVIGRGEMPDAYVTTRYESVKAEYAALTRDEQ